MRRDACASAVAIVAQPVILADDLVAFNAPKAEGNSPVLANIPRGNQGAIAQTIRNHSFVAQGGGIRLVDYLVRECDRIAVRSENPPIGLGKRTTAGLLRWPCPDIGQSSRRRRKHIARTLFLGNPLASDLRFRMKKRCNRPPDATRTSPRARRQSAHKPIASLWAAARVRRPDYRDFDSCVEETS